MAKSKIRQLAEFDFYTKSESDGKVVEQLIQREYLST